MAELNLKATNSSNNDDKCSIKMQMEHLLNNATLITEMALDIKDRCQESQATVTKLKNITINAYKSVNSIKSTSKSFLLLAHKLTLSAMMMLDSIENADLNSLKCEYENLLMVLEKELSDIYDIYSFDDNFYRNLNDIHFKEISSKIRLLEARQRHCDAHVYPTHCNRSFKMDKYPENLSNENMTSLGSNLSPVPEHKCASFAKPMRRPAHFSSLKNLREVKLKLQQVESLSDEDSEAMEHFTLARINYGDRNFSPDNFVDLSE